MARRNRAKRTPPPQSLMLLTIREETTVLDHVETSSRGKWFGPVSPAKFIKTFLPDSPPTQRPRFVRTAWENATPSSAEVKKEKDMYDRFVKAAASFCPSHDVKVTDHSYDNVSWPGEDKQNLIELDVTIYPEGITLDPQRKLDISRVRSFCELKFSEADSGFDDSEGRPFEKEAVNSRKIRGQLATYASAIMATQFRTHVFCVEVTGHHARLIRFDREGAVVTSAFRDTTRRSHVHHPQVPKLAWLGKC
ncbi:hypothetical protein MPER_11270 [Moniliophthora perniciosa FA553]|nr:hypothetical protein MPER_11270 [Moniliophthora perniciosa FA553]